MSAPGDLLQFNPRPPGRILFLGWLIFVLVPGLLLWTLITAGLPPEEDSLRSGVEGDLIQEMQTFEKELEPPPYVERHLSRVIRTTWEESLASGPGLAGLQAPGAAEALRRQMEQTLPFPLTGMIWHGPDTRTCHSACASAWPQAGGNQAILQVLCQVNRQFERRLLLAVPRPSWQLRFQELAEPERKTRTRGYLKTLFGEANRPALVPWQVIPILSKFFGGGRIYALYASFTLGEGPAAPVLGGCLVWVRERDLVPKRLLAEVARGTLQPGIRRSWRILPPAEADRLVRDGLAFGRGAFRFGSTRDREVLEGRPGPWFLALLSQRGTLRVRFPAERLVLRVSATGARLLHPLRPWIPLMVGGVHLGMALGTIVFLYLSFFGMAFPLRIQGKIIAGALVAAALPVGLWIPAFFIQDQVQRERNRDAVLNRLKENHFLVERMIRNEFLDLQISLLELGKSLEAGIGSTPAIIDHLRTAWKRFPFGEIWGVGGDGQEFFEVFHPDPTISGSPENREFFGKICQASLIGIRDGETSGQRDFTVRGFPIPMSMVGDLLVHPGKILIHAFGDRDHVLSLLPIRAGRLAASLVIRFQVDRLLRDFIHRSPLVLRGLQNRVGPWNLRFAIIQLDPVHGRRVIGPVWEPTKGIWRRFRRHLELSASLEIGQAFSQEGSGTVRLISTFKPSRLPCLFLAWAETPAVGRNFVFPTAVGGYLALLIAFVAALLGLVFREPLLEFVRIAGRIEKGEYPADIAVTGGDELGRLGESFQTMIAGLRHRDELSLFVSDEVREAVRDESEAGLAPGGELVQGTVLFAGLRGFRAWAAGVPPEEIVPVLDAFLDVGETVIRDCGGSLDKIVEDTLMGVFREGRATDSQALRAVRAGFEIQRRLAGRFPKATGEFPQAPLCEIGIATGTMVSGRIGSRGGTLDYSVIGNAVNLASRFKSQAKKATRSGILVDPHTIRLLRGRARLGFIDRVGIKGRSRSFSLYEVLSLRPDPGDPRPQSCPTPAAGPPTLRVRGWEPPRS